MTSTADILILRPFNAVFLVTFAAFVLLLVIASLLVRGRSARVKKTVIVAACAVTLIGFFIYKYFLSIDAAYDAITADTGGFNWWGELPFHLCNVNMILIPIAVLTKKRPLLSFCFFVGPLGATLALVMPGNGFDGYSILLPRMIGYFGFRRLPDLAAFPGDRSQRLRELFLYDGPRREPGARPLQEADPGALFIPPAFNPCDSSVCFNCHTGLFHRSQGQGASAEL